MVGQVLSNNDFWASIEQAWSTVDDGGARARLLTPSSDDSEDRYALAEELDKHMDAMLAALRDILNTYTSRRLCVWDAYCERALYDIDREDVHAALDGSDDGFLYARGFVVAAGRAYYDLVNKNPAKYGIMDAECEEMCYFGAHVHQDRFGEWTPKSGISRETCSNKEGWKNCEWKAKGFR